MSGPPRPPRLAVWLASVRLPSEEREFAAGDLIEEYEDRCGRDGAGAARRWVWRHALRGVFTRARGRRDSVAATGPHRGTAMADAWRDLAFAVRLMRRAPLVSVAAVLTFALGVGANAAVFSVAWPVLAAPLPFPDEGRLTYILLSVGAAARANPISPGDYFDLLAARSFESLAGFNGTAQEVNLTSAGEPQQMRLGAVTEHFFHVLGVAPLAGRALDRRDFAPGTRSLVLNERLWRRTFGGDTDVIGTSVRLDGESWTVVGVMPAETTIGTIDVDAWIAQPLDRASARSLRSYFLHMVGRLRSGTTIDAANAELAAIMRGAADRYPASNRLPDGSPLLARAQSYRERLTGPVKPQFLLLIGGAVLVLIVAAINLTALQVTRNLARRQELSVRRALGAGRGVLMRQLLIESLVVSICGGVAGLAAAWLTLNALARLAPTVAWYEVSAQLTVPVILFTVAVTLIGGLIVGLVPGVVVTRHAATDPGAMRVRGATASRRTVHLRTGLVGVQIAMTVVLLVAAALSAASLLRVLQVDPGFEIDRGLIADVRFTGTQGEGIRFFDELVARAGALPGVTRACAINHVPLDNDGTWMTFVAEGQTDADRHAALPMGVTDGCFETLRIPLVRGRAFARRESEPVAILNQSMARALWPDGRDPIGQRVHIGLQTGPLLTVIGVAGDIRAAGLELPDSKQVWTPASRGWPMPQRLILRTEVPPETLAGPLRSLLAQLDPDLALANLRTMDDVVAAATASRRFVLVLLAGFAGITLLLCAVGTYGTLAHQVGQRTREIGIRVALGARRAHVTRALAGHLVVGVGAGIAAGFLGARLLASAMATQLYEMSPSDGRVYAGVAAFVVIVAGVACWSPLRRAGRVEAATVLRGD